MRNNTGENFSAIIERFKQTWPVESWKKFGLFDESYIYYVNVHWLKFSPPNQTYHYILIVFYTIFVIVGTFGNGLILFMYYKCKSLQLPANTLVACLAVSDGGMVLLMLIFVLNSFYFGPVLGYAGCQIYGFWSGVTGNCSICILARISMDRYFMTKDPLKHKLNKKRMKTSIIVCWLYSTGFAALPLLNIGVGKFVPEGYLTSCSFDYLTKTRAVKVFIFCYFVGAWVLPLSVILYAYVNIYRITQSSSKIRESFSSMESVRHCKKEEKRRQEFKLTIVCSVAVILWIISWTPYAILALTGITGNAQWITPTTSMVPALFCKTASCLDPFVYAFSHPKFRAEIISYFFRRKTVTKFHKNRRCAFYKNQTKITGTQSLSLNIFEGGGLRN